MLGRGSFLPEKSEKAKAFCTPLPFSGLVTHFPEATVDSCPTESETGLMSPTGFMSQKQSYVVGLWDAEQNICLNLLAHWSIKVLKISPSGISFESFFFY